MVLTPCNAVHTVGMRFPIDVVFVDGKGCVKKIVHDLPPWRMAASIVSRSTIELPAGALGPTFESAIAFTCHRSRANQNGPLQD